MTDRTSLKPFALRTCASGRPQALALACLLAVVSFASLPASTPQMAIDELRPGMLGTGVTVFQGESREDFKVQIIGVLKNVVGPRRNLILARLEGGPLASTGVIAGMSGSPVYVEGRLIGAVSYSLGAFSKEPIAGITPIAEMTETAALATPRPPSQRARVEWPVTPDSLVRAFREAFGAPSAFAERPADVQAFGVPAVAAEHFGVSLRPIFTPLVMGGFTADSSQLLSSVFADRGFVPVAGGGAGLRRADASPLQPGDAIGIGLISGDLSLAGAGTVTLVDGDRVFAFGHPFYNLGPTAFPMTRANIETVLPSLFTSTKIASIGEIIGTFQQDRATAIAGTLGPGPALIPVKIGLDSERGLRKSFRFDLVQDQLFTPLLTYVTIVNTLKSYEREFGAATFTVKGTATVKGHGDISFEDIFTGDSPSIGAATYIVAPITFLLSNDREPVEIEAVDISIASTEQPRTATLERVWLDDVRPRAGRAVALKILTRTYRGDETIRTIPIDIPANASGSLSILVSDGTRLAQMEQRELRQSLPPQSVGQMIRALNKARKNNRLYVKLLSPDSGAVVNGEALSALPASVLAVLEGEKSGGSFIPLRSASIGEWELATDYAVRGSRLLTIDVEPQ